MFQAPLIQRIGGKASIVTAVDLFYDKVLKDDRINFFFENTDMEKLRSHQKAFMIYAFGGLPAYSGRNMRDAHKRLVEEKGLNESHFNAVAENLRHTLVELNVPEDLIFEVMDIIAHTKDDVLNR